MTAQRLALAVASLGLSASAAYAVPVFTDNFNTTASSSSYNVFQTTGAATANTGTAVFAFNYGSAALGIPSAPNSGDSTTLGLRVQSDDTTGTTSDLIGAISVSTKNLALPSTYKVQVDVWGNYVGGTTIADAGGTNGTTGALVAAAVKGTTYASATTNGATQEGGFLTDAIRDASASGGTYRVYINGANQANGTNTQGIYAAASGAGDTTAPAYTNAFYASKFPSKTAPAAQSSAASVQTGATPAGVFGFAWHVVTITNDGTNTIWAIDGNTIATVADTAYTNGGTQVSLGDQDGNTGAGTSANQLLYNFDLFDNLIVTDLASAPEPASLAAIGLGCFGLLTRRRKA